MSRVKGFLVCLAILLFITTVNAQRPEVTISLNESFFDSLFDAIFQNAGPIEFSIASGDFRRRDAETQSDGSARASSSGRSGEQFRSPNQTRSFSPFSASQRLRVEKSFASPRLGGESPVCKEVIQLLRETNGVRTAVRFRDGKILAPLAFTGSYSPPFVGCVSFTGYAETVIDLEFDQQNQRLIARARVLNVSLNGTGGVGGTMIAKLVQSSIDKKINPIEVIRMDKLSFALPIQNAAIKMKVAGIRHDFDGANLRLHIAYDFTK